MKWSASLCGLREVKNLTADGVVVTYGISGGVFLSRERLLKVRELHLRASAHFIHHRWLKIDEDLAARGFLRQFPIRRCRTSPPPMELSRK